MQQMPLYVYLSFGATVIVTIWLLFKATRYSKLFMIIVLAWLTCQSVLSIGGFYSYPPTMTTRFGLLIVPALILILYGFASKSGRAFIDKADLRVLTIIHVIRIPVELVLLWLFIHDAVPQAMTFHGSNMDIFSGITAPVVYYFGFVKKTISNRLMIVWNIVCLLLLFNVVTTAQLSLPARFERYGFEQPNLALAFFPFVLLPAFLVPVVLFSMLASIRLLLKKVQQSRFHGLIYRSNMR
jgi:hypothetical protein